MSILRQLLLSITIAIAIILLGTLALSVNAARDYLAGQLQVQSSDAAVSLALSLSQPANSSRVTQELLVSALYDGGHFALVRLTDPQGKVIIERSGQSASTTVPGWFQRLVPLSAKSASHVVTDGWRQIGEVTLTANDVYAWETLWESSVQMILVIVAAGAVWALFAFVLVRWIEKRLLAEVGEHMLAIGRGQFGGPLTARVPELSGITQALNQTREQLRATAEEQTARIESLEIEVNQDPVTGLANRKYFINEFLRAVDVDAAKAAPRGEPLPESGHVLVFRQRDLAAINRHMPREFVDQWLAGLGSRVAALLDQFQLGGTLVARLNGSDFALLLPACTAPTAMLVAERLRSELREARIPVGEGGLCRWALAMTDYQRGAKVGDLLGRLDFALMRGESAGDDHVQLATDEAQALSAHGESAWRQAITDGIERQRFTLALEPLRAQDGSVIRQEATLMLHSQGSPEPIPAKLFIPAATRLDLTAECDIQAVRLAVSWLMMNEGDVTVRIAMPSLSHPNFLLQVERMLAERKPLASRLYLEVDAHAVAERRDAVAELCRIARDCGAHVGVRRLAQQLSAVSQLHSLSLAYVKLGGGFVTGMARSLGSQQLAMSVLETARSLGIQVYAEDVPDEATRGLLARLGVAVMRGPGVVAGNPAA
ncbi:LapD/MoxY N-terminal periplasmic domain-containing protein [Bordetella bronchialis]|uniref:Diguanylate phosphodiesterase n=1 Tax=Bordetella bronchialis TaxID=463025 RepID=A0A193FXA6_9BORD|nr:LapD/MoxY N-terminal periplasmic domain-containing protein [Bordetella bronchialis]ANN66739.1 diguanylate phosphodiesterase [Bordetella bronchialis]ANN71816.1 diguanylate phosphodiesterase [Bordetella bronchialis]